MKHAGAEALRRLESLLEEIRRRQGLKEKKPGIFYRKSKAFLHFHEDPAGLFADLRGADEFDRFQVNTAAQEQRLLDEIDRRLSD
jgi:hypothetical protein